MGNNAWSNPGPAKQIIIVGPQGTPPIIAYSPTKGTNDITFALVLQAMIDAFGNRMSSGLNLYTNHGNFPGIFFVADATSIAQPSALKIVGVGTDGLAQLQLLSNSLQLVSSGNEPDLYIAALGNGVLRLGTASPSFREPQNLQVGPGPVGRYYSEIVSLSAAAGIATGGAVKPFTGFASRICDTDYAAASQFSLSGGSVTFTAPDDGWYTSTLRNEYLGWVNGSVTRIALTYNGGFAFPPYSSGALLNTESTSINAGRITDTIMVKLGKNDTLTPSCFQNTGALQTPDASICYMSVRREL